MSKGLKALESLHVIQQYKHKPRNHITKTDGSMYVRTDRQEIKCHVPVEYWWGKITSKKFNSAYTWHNPQCITNPYPS